MGLLSPNKLDDYLDPTLAQDQLLMGFDGKNMDRSKKMSPPALAYFSMKWKILRKFDDFIGSKCLKV